MPSELDEILSGVKVQVSTRITASTKRRLDAWLDWRNGTHESALPGVAINWPSSVTEIVEEALLNWLAEHPIKAKTGPREPHKQHTKPTLARKNKEE